MHLARMDSSATVAAVNYEPMCSFATNLASACLKHEQISGEWAIYPDQAGPYSTGVLPFLRQSDTVYGTAGLPTATPATNERGQWPTDVPVPDPLEVHVAANEWFDISKFDVADNWSNLKHYAPPPHGWGCAEFSMPKNCRIKQAHQLQRHGARYDEPGPQVYAVNLFNKLAKDKVELSGPLAQLKEFKAEGFGVAEMVRIGMQQLFVQGVNAYYRYGQLAEKFFNPNSTDKLVARTTSQERMYQTAQYFLTGFFGLGFEKYANLEVQIEAEGFNSTLAPDQNCPRALQVPGYQDYFAGIYLKDATERFNKYTKGYKWNTTDVFHVQALCPYLTVASGMSPMCALFSEKEWEGFGYAKDLNLYTRYGFGSATGRVMGMGYVAELRDRLLQKQYDPKFQTSQNTTFNKNEQYFPLNQSLYLDFTHDSIISGVLTALGMKQFNEGLPVDNLPDFDRWYRLKDLTPFAAHIVTEIIECHGEDDDYVHLLLNDRTVSLPLSHPDSCEARPDGWCKKSSFLDIIDKELSKVDWHECCFGDYDEMYLAKDGLIEKK